MLVTLPGSAGNRPCTWRGAVLEKAAGLVGALVKEMNPPVALIGDTFGARVALETALQLESDQIQNLVLYDFVPYQWPFQNKIFKAYRSVHSPTVFAAQARLAPPGYWAASSNFAIAVARDFTSEESRAEVMRSLRRSDPVTVSYEWFRATGSKTDLSDLVTKLSQPTLVIWPRGTKTQARKNTAEVEAQYSLIEGVEWFELDGYGAGAMLDAPSEVATAMLMFWSKVGF